jgi:hypothetical protein
MSLPINILKLKVYNKIPSLYEIGCLEESRNCYLFIKKAHNPQNEDSFLRFGL